MDKEDFACLQRTYNVSKGTIRRLMEEGVPPDHLPVVLGVRDSLRFAPFSGPAGPSHPLNPLIVPRVSPRLSVKWALRAYRHPKVDGDIESLKIVVERVRGLASSIYTDAVYKSPPNRRGAAACFNLAMKSVLEQLDERGRGVGY